MEARLQSGRSWINPGLQNTDDAVQSLNSFPKNFIEAIIEAYWGIDLRHYLQREFVMTINKPNILLIMADQQRYDSLGGYSLPTD